MGIFGWLRPEEEPEGKALTEISNDQGDHVVVETDSLDDACEVEGIARKYGRATVDKDEGRTGTIAEMEYESRDPDQLRVRSGRVEDPDEDLEPDEDDDSLKEDDEQPNNVDGNQSSSSGGWWPFG